ncbi:MAG: hypothetical protein ACPGWR_17440 [Ardenticatenaceae bacterium]
MKESLLRSFLHHLDPDRRVTILRSSQDPGLHQMFTFLGALGSTDMEPDKKIYVMIHDAGGASKAVWLEELAHARQFMIYGSPDLSSDLSEICKREIEVHECLLKNAKRLNLTPQEIVSCEEHILHYKEL